MQELLQAERDKRRNGEVMLDGVEVTESGDSDLEDFGDSQFEEPSEMAPEKLMLLRRELFEIRELLSASH